MSLAAGAAALFLFVATWTDVRSRGVPRWLFWGTGIVLAFGAGLDWWQVSILGAVAGYLLLTLAGTLTGDRIGGLLVGAFLGPIVVWAILAAFVVAYIWWRRWGDERSPGDFAFYPFLSLGVGLTLAAMIVR